MIAATLGVTRGGNVLAWDNNETRGTLGWRGIPSDHNRTAVDLLQNIDLLRAPEASNADLDPYVRPQGGMQIRSEEHTSELQSRGHLVCRLLLEKKKPPPHETQNNTRSPTTTGG